MKSEKRTTVYFEASSADRLCELLGAYDENLKTLSAELGVEISVADGLTLKISGEKENVVLCEKALKAAAGAAEKGERIDERQILYCIETAKSGESEETEKLFDGVVATTATGKKIKCKTLGQKRYAEAIDKNSVVFGIGPAGTGKTYLAVAKAVAAFKAKKAEKIILTRPAVEAGENLGFLPGDLQEKVDPYLRPLYDALQEMFGAEQYEKLMERGVIEVAPLAYMRGRTLSSAFIILDEAQNTTREQMKMFLTRMGEGSKAVVTGDATQVDLPRGKSCGLTHAAKILKDVEGVQVCMLSDKDVVRHPLVMRIVKAYEKDEEREEALAREREEKRRSALSAARGKTLPEADGRHKGENVK